MAFRQSNSHRREAGNVFFALFGTIVLVAVLGATVASFIKGPLSSSIQVTRSNAVETQMAVISQVMVMQGTSCDADPVIEPIAWRLASGSEPRPNKKISGVTSAAGLVPLTLGVASTVDPWGTQIGYCVWDHGSSSCGSTERLAGAATNPDTETVIALISAGPDKKFTTTCRDFATATTDAKPLVAKNASNDDDIIFSYSYDQASSASGGLWTLASANLATIGRDLEVGGSSVFTGAGSFGTIATDSISGRTENFIEAMDGFKLPDASTFNPTCNADIAGVVRRNVSALQVCVNGAWTSATSGSGGSSGSGSGPGSLETGTSAGCSVVGALRFNTTSKLVEYCNGTEWRSLIARAAATALKASPSSALNMTVTGPCLVEECPKATGQSTFFIVSNVGAAAVNAVEVTVTGADPTAYSVTTPQTSACQGATLAPGATCVVMVTPIATATRTYNGIISVGTGASTILNIPVRTVATGFNCLPGAHNWGGIVVSCANSTTPDYIINDAGCGSGTIEPECTGNNDDDPSMSGLYKGIIGPDLVTRNWGGQNAANMAGYGSNGPLAYCNALVKDGYDNWYLPSLWEYATLVSMSKADLSVIGKMYWTSTYAGENDEGAAAYKFHVEYEQVLFGDSSYPYEQVRCMRRHGMPIPAPELDRSPQLINLTLTSSSFSPPFLGRKFAITASQSITSDLYLVGSINTGTPISITGPGSPTFRINGGNAVSSGTVYQNNAISITAVGPATTGQENLFALTIGDKTYNWEIAYPTANTRQIFVTSTTYLGTMGGSGGGLARADFHCQTRATAAGLTGTWYAVLSDMYAHAQNRFPWNWNRLENRGGELVALNAGDLMDGFVTNPIRFTETGTRSNSVLVWTGMMSNGPDNYEPRVVSFSSPTSLGRSCDNWTNYGTADATRAYVGNSGSVTPGMFSNVWTADCGSSRALYCIGPF